MTTDEFSNKGQSFCMHSESIPIHYPSYFLNSFSRSCTIQLQGWQKDPRTVFIFLSFLFLIFLSFLFLLSSLYHFGATIALEKGLKKSCLRKEWDLTGEDSIWTRRGVRSLVLYTVDCGKMLCSFFFFFLLYLLEEVNLLSECNVLFYP